jgi:membrane-associated phospholipid phosphatase
LSTAGLRIAARWFGVLAVVAALALLVSSCQWGKTTSSEPTGGTWRPILLQSVDAIRLPAPPRPGSDEERRERDELLRLQKERTPEQVAAVHFWNEGATVRWNEIARDLVAKHRTSHAQASRAYALLSVAQYDALVAAWNNKYFYRRRPPEATTSGLKPIASAPPDPVYPSEHAAVAAASATVLGYLYPDETSSLQARASEDELSRLIAGVNFRSDVAAGDALGRSAAQVVIDHGRSDGSDARWKGEVPKGPGLWTSAPNDQPLLPLWGQIQPWLMPSVTDFRAPPPPAYGSPEFLAALAEVKGVSDHRTPEEARTAALWADGDGSYTPAGRWNKMAADLVFKYDLAELRTARVFALLNMAMADAEVACWDNKYHYWYIRPSQADPSITTPVGLPNFPSYPSSHACLSGAGSATLTYVFPRERAYLAAKAEEAAQSRVFGGIHYRFDSVAGLAVGRAVAKLAIERGRTDGSP